MALPSQTTRILLFLTPFNLKRIPYNMKRTIFTVALTLFITTAIFAFFAFKSAAPAPAGGSDIVVVQATLGSSSWSKILISYGDANTEVVKMATFDPQNFVSNNETLAATLNRMVKEGYEMVGTSGGGAGNGFIVSTYIFKKK